MTKRPCSPCSEPGEHMIHEAAIRVRDGWRQEGRPFGSGTAYQAAARAVAGAMDWAQHMEQKVQELEAERDKYKEELKQYKDQA